MILESCRRRWHPLSSTVETQTKPEGPQGMVYTRVHRVCRFCGHSRFVRTKRVVNEFDHARGVR